MLQLREKNGKIRMCEVENAVHFRLNEQFECEDEEG